MEMFLNFRDMAMSASREMARRTALARQPRPAGVSGPPLKFLLAEFGALAGRARTVAVERHQAGRPQPVMLLPGFGASPGRMRRMQQAFEDAGHVVQDWGLGFNL